MHISDYLVRNAQTWPDKLALVTAEREMTWRQLADEVDSAARALSARLPAGKSQQIIGLVMPNTWQHVVANLAIVHTGHIALPIDVIFKPLEINAVIGQIGPTLVIVDEANRSRVSSSTKVVGFSELVRPASGGFKPLRFDARRQVASLLFTSGTTGKPKAALYTHRNHIWNIEACSRVWNWTERDSLLISLRLSHMHGLVMGLSGMLYHGNTMFLEENFDAERTLELLAGGRVSFFTHASLAYMKLLEQPGDWDISKVRLLVSGAAPLPPPVWQKFKARFGQEIVETYGSTETGRIAANPLDQRLPGSPGRVLPSAEVKLSDEHEVLVKSEGVSPGYYKNPVATKAALLPGGWWRTGDIGRFEGDRLVLKGRRHERIRKQGYTVSPRDVEWAMHQFDKIKEVYVMGIASPNQPSDELAYFMVTDATEAEIRDFCKQNLPSIWRPDHLIVLDKIPRNRSGKPQLSKLRAMIN